MPDRRLAMRTAALVTILASGLAAQDHQHVAEMTHPSATTASVPTRPGQAAFGAIAEVVALLDADPATDWSRVDIEALRQHLIDMDNVTMRSRIAAVDVPGGFRASVTGTGEVVASVRRMTTAHARQMRLDGLAEATVTEIPGGVRLTVTATTPDDPRAVARLRGLGAIGFLTLGDHHQAHHAMIARGMGPH